MNFIYIKELAVNTIIGIHDWERANKQEVKISIKLFPASEIVPDNDEITGTLNYQTVAELVTKRVEDSQFMLVEKLAQFVGNLLLAQFELERVEIQIGKPAAIPNAAEAGVSLVFSADSA